MTKIKICGLFREIDVDYVNEAMPDYAGFILDFPPSRRSLTPSAAAALRRRLAPGVRAVGVFVDRPVEAVAAAAGAVGLDVVQLHGGEDDAYIAALRERTGIEIWKAFRVRSAADLAAARASAADAVLLDNGRGTGEQFDWTLIAGFDRPFALAGGLTPENLPAAVRALGPELADLSSGVETDGRKDREKILAAVRAVRETESKKEVRT